MTPEQRYICLAEMDAYTDRDAYVSDLALSYMWEDTPESDIPQERLEQLSRLWDAVHLPIKTLLATLTPTQASRLYCIPVRTLENWYAEIRTCPVYVRLYLSGV